MGDSSALRLSAASLCVCVQPRSAHRNEKNLLDFFPLATIDGRTNTLYSEPFSTNGTLTLHVRIHSPFTRTAHVPHSPLPHLYLMYCPA